MDFLRVTQARLQRLHDNTKWFTEPEAWMVFRVAAFGEAIGWTLLISGILYDKSSLPAGDILLTIAGKFHGLLFALYIVGALLVSKSMGWGIFRMIFALAVSVPPYGTLFFEQYLAWLRRR